MPERHEHAAHDGERRERHPEDGERGDVRERPDCQHRVGLRRGQSLCQLVGVLAGHDVGVDELAGELGPPLRPPAGRAHADELDVGMRGGTQQSDRVVGIVADVGVDPEAHV